MTFARTIKPIASLCLIFLLALPLWNLAVSRWQHARNPVPGNLYSVNGRQMHIDCTGSGSPTVVIETGAGASWLGWQGVQSRLAPITRVCTYDRAGHGWSEPRFGPRDAETIARELHALLNQAGVQRPLVLVGHSFGGLIVREYAREFPVEVAGAVLIDSSSPHQLDEIPGERASYEADKRNQGRELIWEKLRVWSGWERIVGDCHDEPSKELAYLAGQYNALMCRPAYVGGEDSEIADFEISLQQAGRLSSFGNIPLLVLSRDTTLPENNQTPQAMAKNQIWDREQEASKSLSPLSWRVIARSGGHSLHHQRLDLVGAEMTRLIQYLRGGPAPSFGSTAME